MAKPSRFSQLSPSCQALVRLCQSINHGHIEGLLVVDGEPTFTPAPTLLVDVKLDQEEGPRREVRLPDDRQAGVSDAPYEGIFPTERWI